MVPVREDSLNIDSKGFTRLMVFISTRSASDSYVTSCIKNITIIKVLGDRWITLRTILPPPSPPENTLKRTVPSGQLLPRQFPPGKKPDLDTSPWTALPRSLEHGRPLRFAHKMFLHYGVSPNHNCNSCFWNTSWLRQNTFNLCLVFWVYIHRYTKRAER